MDTRRPLKARLGTIAAVVASWRFYAIAAGLGLAAGCQPVYWYQEGKTFDECKADLLDCRAELIQRTDRPHMSDYERRFMENCMEQRGYRLVGSDDLPLDVKREEPNAVTAVPWNRFWGMAGTLDESSVLPHTQGDRQMH